jgi:hypothetical protein
MHLSRPFDPLAPGEYDNFGFDFTADMGGATIVSTNWTCALKPLQNAVDPAPQAHVVVAYVQTQIGSGLGPLVLVAAPPSALAVAGAAVVLTGAFSVARVGGFVPSQSGATYQLEATVVTSDGRTLSLSADLPIGPS